MTIKQASIHDNEDLTEITKKSKAYWGYSDEQIALWSEILTITKEYIETYSIYKLVVDAKIIGYYSFIYENGHTVKLDNLFVLPDFIGKGFGKILLNDFLLHIHNKGIKKVILQSDPNAEMFYKRFGFIKTGQIETSIKDRYLPVMELNITG